MEKQPKDIRQHRSQIIPLTIIGIGLIILGLVATKVIFIREPSNNSSVVPSVVNFRAPDLRLNNLSGEEIRLSDYREQIVMINNWATWCPPCKAEMPVLQDYYHDHQDQGFMLFGIEAGDPQADVASFVKEYRLTFPILLDPRNQSLTAFNNDSLPSSYVIDHDGYVRLAWTGPINRDMLEKYVTPLLEQ
jgi:cytochrome c biogenesis protein CcmG, thiol:disulfide interchange protein DsbE